MTKKIFRSTLLVAVCALLASLVLIMGCLYDYFAGLQSQALRDELTLAASGVSQGGEGGAHRGSAICPAELHKVLRVPVRVVGAHVAHRGRSDFKHRPCPQRCVARGGCGGRECERPSCRARSPRRGGGGCGGSGGSYSSPSGRSRAACSPIFQYRPGHDERDSPEPRRLKANVRGRLPAADRCAFRRYTACEESLPLGVALACALLG